MKLQRLEDVPCERSGTASTRKRGAGKARLGNTGLSPPGFPGAWRLVCCVGSYWGHRSRNAHHNLSDRRTLGLCPIITAVSPVASLSSSIWAGASGLVGASHYSSSGEDCCMSDNRCKLWIHDLDRYINALPHWVRLLPSGSCGILANTTERASPLIVAGPPSSSWAAVMMRRCRDETRQIHG